LELGQVWRGVTQGSPGCAGATLGFGTESRWDSCSEANGNTSDTKGQLAAGKAGLSRVVCPGSSTRPAIQSVRPLHTHIEKDIRVIREIRG